MEQHTHHSPNGSNSHALVSVSDAADILGITASAVRKRINRGRLSARKVDGQWHVALDEEHLVKASAEESADLAAARQQLEAIRDEWLQPLIARIGSQAEQIGRLEERVRHLERERSQLLAERNRLRTALVSHAGQDPAASESRPDGERLMIAGVRFSDQVALVGIALTLGLWVILGLLAWLAVG